MVFAAEGLRTFGLGVEQPEGNVHTLDFLDMVFRLESLRQQELALIVFLQGLNRLFLRGFEGDDQVGFERIAQSSGDDGVVAAIRALRNRRAPAHDQSGTARRAHHACSVRVAFFERLLRLQVRGNGIVAGYLGLRIGTCMLGFARTLAAICTCNGLGYGACSMRPRRNAGLFTGRIPHRSSIGLRLLFGVIGLDLLDGKGGIAIIASGNAGLSVEMKRAPARGTLVGKAFTSHNSPSSSMYSATVGPPKTATLKDKRQRDDSMCFFFFTIPHIAERSFIQLNTPKQHLNRVA